MQLKQVFLYPSISRKTFNKYAHQGSWLQAASLVNFAEMQLVGRKSGVPQIEGVSRKEVSRIQGNSHQRKHLEVTPQGHSPEDPSFSPYRALLSLGSQRCPEAVATESISIALKIQVQQGMI